MQTNIQCHKNKQARKNDYMNQAEQRGIARNIQDDLMAYWHDVDFNWGLNAGAHYSEDAVFEGGSIYYDGRAEIEEFYAWRKERGARVNVHLVGNFKCQFESDTLAKVAWICTLYAHDGEVPQPTAAPISITRVEDVYIFSNGQWLCKHRKWNALFRGGVPTTSLSAEELAKRKANKSKGE